MHNECTIGLHVALILVTWCDDHKDLHSLEKNSAANCGYTFDPIQHPVAHSFCTSVCPQIVFCYSCNVHYTLLYVLYGIVLLFTLD